MNATWLPRYVLSNRLTSLFVLISIFCSVRDKTWHFQSVPVIRSIQVKCGFRNLFRMIPILKIKKGGSRLSITHFSLDTSYLTLPRFLNSIILLRPASLRVELISSTTTTKIDVSPPTCVPDDFF